MAELFYLPIVLLAAVVGMGVGFFAWLQGDQPGARPLTILVAAASFWAVAEGLAIATAGVGSLRFWTQVGFTFSTIVPIAWLAVVLEYTGREQWLSRSRLGLLLVEPAVFVFLVWTNTGHGLVWTDASQVVLGEYTTLVLEFGLAFWGHQVYSYLLVTAGAVLLFRMVLASNQLYRSQSTALLFAITISMAGNALYIFELLPAGIDPSGLTYVLSGVVLAGAMFRTRLLQIAPAVRELGREVVLTELDDCLYILDEDDRIIETNPAGEQLLDATESSHLGQSLGTALPSLADAIDSGQSLLRFDTGGSVRYYDIQVSSISRAYGTLSGRLVSLREVTDQRRREQQLDVLNRLLRHNVRNELNVVRGNVDLARDDIEDEHTRARLRTAIQALDTVVERSEKVGRLSRLFDTDTDGTLDLADHLAADLDRTSRNYPDADIDLAFPAPLLVEAGPTLPVAFEELVVNAIEHNDSDTPRVALAVDERASDDATVVVTVSDNGPGIEEQEYRALAEGRETPLEHASGVGLWLANWVVEHNGGSLSFQTTPAGTTVSVRLPRAQSEAGQTADARE
ncbi:histidine kinase N-terminal 7TM domain-containing protein [Salinibaculum rarum]|uniref:sensor histidine kinase n=1 Tax=Salinibaculum rarum TaxID=3058903 RepID=UPI00265EEC57|nr:histidine kinase N-terminal 7TM domain-containing protein [Salinibaculum sp. KK48]